MGNSKKKKSELDFYSMWNMMWTPYDEFNVAR